MSHCCGRTGRLCRTGRNPPRSDRFLLNTALSFCLYKKQDEDDQNHDIKYDLAREIVTELEDEVGVPADTYLFDSWFARDSTLVKHIESYGNDWIGPLRSNRQETYAGEEIGVDALAERIDTVGRNVEGKMPC